MKNILITGGAGFIGSHLCDLLLAQGYKVVCLDNLLTGAKANIAYHSTNKNFRFIKHDIIRPVVISGAIDYVLHFASPASPKDYEKLPLETLKVGSIGTLNALEVARDKKARFVLASTSEVYGDPFVSPQREDYYGNVNSIGPRSCYDEAKRFAEALTVNYAKKYKVDCRIARIFNTYGPRMRKNDGRVVPNFINQALAGRPLTIYGDGKQTRSFCYVADLIDGIFKLMTIEPKKVPGRPVVNLGNPHEFRMTELADLVEKLMGRKMKRQYLPLPGDDPKQRRPDIGLAKKILRWRPKVQLKDGLEITIDYFRKRPNIPKES